MSTNDFALTADDDNNKSAPIDEHDTLPRTLFVHIPKTGGTTLDSILADHYFSYSLVRNVQFISDVSLFSKINEIQNRYVSGHLPVSIADGGGFEEKITILRNPIDVLCSHISFVEKIGGEFARLSLSLEGGREFEIYREYFSPNFDLERFLIDRAYGLASGYFNYSEQCNVEDAVNVVAGFDFIMDFDHLDDGIKTLIISKGFFPYSEIARNRSYSYRPDNERARKLLSEFDEKFYMQMRSHFIRTSGNIGAYYDRYKKRYCKTQGISLEVYQGKNVDLRGPIGVGWNNFEISEYGVPFRWSGTSKPTIELPVANAGSYVVYFYWFRGQAKNVVFRITTLIGEETFIPTLVEDGEINVSRCCISLHSADWIYANFEIEQDSDADRQSMNQPESDLRTLGIILGNVYIRRLASI